MNKSRLLEGLLGDRLDGKYYASSTSGPYNSVTMIDRLARMAHYYEEGRQLAATVAVKPTGMGSQNIESSTNPKPIFNNVLNTKFVGHNYPFGIIYSWKSPTTYRTHQPYYRMNCVGSFQNIGALNTQTWADVEGCQRRAWWAMQPRFESEVSILNFIYELKDFSHLAKAMSRFRFDGVCKQLKNVRRRLTRIEQASGTLAAAGKTSRNALGILNDAYLQNQFAIQPLIKDVANIVELAVDAADEAQAEFGRRGEREQRSHYAEMLSEKYEGTWGSGNNDHIFTGRYSKNVFNATLEYTYKYNFRTGYEKLKRQWGLDLNAGVIWEAIPFSFIVDYFFEVGKAIRNMELDPNVNAEYKQYCESMLAQVSYGMHIDIGNSRVVAFHGPSIGPGVDSHIKMCTPVSGYTGSYYRRRITSPNKGTALPRVKFASSRQTMNCASLILGFML